MSLLNFSAGATAFDQIQRDGLSPNQVSAIFGASGAAKWLSIYGLDRAIFSQWLTGASHQIRLFGTSVGAFKLAAACHTDPAVALDNLAHGYIAQSFPNGINADEIEREFQPISDLVSGGAKAEEILTHPYLRFACGAVRCHGGLASYSTKRQATACAQASAINLKGRAALANKLDRVVFHDNRCEFPIHASDGYRTQTVPLDVDNFRAALKASGSIPVYMHGVEDIAGAGPGMYRDGGLLDYHPVPGNFWRDDGLILYPHFYPDCKVGWFDKFLPWRKAGPALLDQAVIISPSDEFWATTELGRTPDRQDFARFRNNNAERIRLWQNVAEQSHLLGEEFLQLARSGDLGQHLKLLR